MKRFGCFEIKKKKNVIVKRTYIFAKKKRMLLN